MHLIGFIVARLREPSTWASVAAFLALVGVHMPADWVRVLPEVVAAVAGVAAALGMTLPEAPPRAPRAPRAAPAEPWPKIEP